MAVDLERIDVYEFLNDLGLNNIREDGKDVWYSCFSDSHYRGDANPSASMEKGTTRFYCFSCGMHGNAVTFLAEFENVSPIQAAIWIKEKYGGDAAPSRETILDNVKEILNTKQKIKEKEESKILDDTEANRRRIEWKSAQAWLQYSGDEYDANDEAAIYMLSRGFTPEILNKFEIGFDKISQRIAIPIRDIQGRLIGFKGRTLNPEERNRYIVLGGAEYGFEPYLTKKVVFALDKAIQSESYLTSKQIILCEGELNAIAMHQCGFDNAVGISGKVLSDEQVQLITQKAGEVILIFDEQDDAINAANKLRLVVPTSIVPEHDKDPADMSGEEVVSLLARRTSALV